MHRKSLTCLWAHQMLPKSRWTRCWCATFQQKHFLHTWRSHVYACTVAIPPQQAITKKIDRETKPYGRRVECAQTPFSEFHTEHVHYKACKYQVGFFSSSQTCVSMLCWSSPSTCPQLGYNTKYTLMQEHGAIDRVRNLQKWILDTHSG